MSRRSLANMIAAVLIVVASFAAGYALFGRAPVPGKAGVAEPATVPAPLPSLAPPTHTIGGDSSTPHGGGALTESVETALPEDLPLLWRFKAGAPVRQTPAACEGRVYFTTARGEVIAIDLDGQRAWSRELFSGKQGKDGPLRARIEAPVACFGGLVIVGTMGGVIHALDTESGADKWQTPIDSPVMGTAGYLADATGGRVYVVAHADGVLHALDAATGAILWRTEPTDRCDGSPAVSERAAVFGSCAAALHVFSPATGAPMRRIELDADSQVAGGVALDGDWIVSGCRSGKVLQANAATGAVAWTNTDVEAEIFTTPAITADRVVVAAEDGFVYALDRADGALRWRFDTEGTPSSPVIAGDKVLVSANGALVLLRLEDGAKVLSVKVSDEITSPALADGRVFVGSEDGTVVAFGNG